MIREDGHYIIKYGKNDKYKLDIAYFDTNEWRISCYDYPIDENSFSYISPKPIDLNKIFEILNNGNESDIT